jgi:hypothetical protein
LGLSANAVQVKPAVEKAVNEFAARLSFVGRGACSVLLWKFGIERSGWATEARGVTLFLICVAVMLFYKPAFHVPKGVN